MIAALVLAAALQCAPYQHVTVAGKDWIRNPGNFNGGNACLSRWNGTVSFTVKSATAPPPPGGGVSAYPSIGRGCLFPPFPGVPGDCTAGWKAKPVTAMAGSALSWVSSRAGVSAAARYNTGADLWFSAGPLFTEPVTEVMLWQDTQHLAQPARAVRLSIGGRGWWYWTRQASDGTAQWTEIVFTARPFTTAFRRVPLQPLLEYAVRRGTMSAASYWQGAALGFELWDGGTGLKTISGWVHP